MSGRQAKPLEGFYTTAEAGKLLGVGSAAIRRIMARGNLRSVRVPGYGKQHYVYREEVHALVEIKDQGAGTRFDTQNFLLGLKVRLHSIETQQQFLMETMGLDVSVLRDKPIEILIALYDRAKMKLTENPRFIRTPETREWANALCQLTEIEFQRLVAPTQDIHPWRPFHTLCMNLLLDLRRRKRFASDPGQQQIYRVMDKARKQLSAAALVFEHAMSSNFGPLASAEINKFYGQPDSLNRFIEAEVGLPEAEN